MQILHNTMSYYVKYFKSNEMSLYEYNDNMYNNTYYVEICIHVLSMKYLISHRVYVFTDHITF